MGTKSQGCLRASMRKVIDSFVEPIVSIPARLDVNGAYLPVKEGYIVAVGDHDEETVLTIDFQNAF